jgi:formate dehydrogenase (hydrogenase)
MGKKHQHKPLPRLTEPMVRDNGVLRVATWPEAITRATEGFQRVLRAPNADPTKNVGVFSCSKATNEVNFLLEKFGRTVFGTNNIDSCNRT